MASSICCVREDFFEEEEYRLLVSRKTRAWSSLYAVIQEMGVEYPWREWRMEKGGQGRVGLLPY